MIRNEHNETLICNQVTIEWPRIYTIKFPILKETPGGRDMAVQNITSNLTTRIKNKITSSFQTRPASILLKGNNLKKTHVSM